MTKSDRLALRESIGKGVPFERREMRSDPRAKVANAFSELGKAIRAAKRPGTLAAWENAMSAAYRCAAYIRVVVDEARLDRAVVDDIRKCLEAERAR